MYLVKLGGSVITDKTRECTPRLDVLARLVEELKDTYLSGEKLIIVHGAGSFGHIKAKQWGVKEGIPTGMDNRKRLQAAFSIQADVRRLNLHVLDAFCTAEIPAASLPPGATGMMKDGALWDLDVEKFQSALKRGVVPVSFGDVVMDSKRTFAICSGDEVMYHIVSNMDIEHVFFVCDVDGLYDSDPKDNPEAILHRKISVQEIKETANAEMKAHGSGTDVTGAMWGKVKWAVRIAEHGTPVHFLNGKIPGRLREALRKKDVVQTILEA